MAKENKLLVFKDRTNILPVSFGYDISGDVFVSEIKDAPNQNGTVLATWVSSWATDGTDGELVLTLDDSVTSLITEKKGYMDIKRLSGGEPIHVCDIIEVFFKDTVTT